MEMHVSYISRLLADRGHVVKPICAPGSPLEKDFIRCGLEPFRLSLSGYFHPTQIVKLSHWIQDQDVELIHAHYSRDLWTLVPALELGRLPLRIPLVLTKHLGTQRPKRDILHRLLYRRVDKIIAISRVIRDNIVATHPVTAAQVELVYHGVDSKRFHADPALRERARSELGFTAEHLVFGIAGRLQFSKGYLEFLEMAVRLREQYPNVRFLIVGEPTVGEPEEAYSILKRLAVPNLAEIVRHVGFQSDMPKMYAAMDVFVFPSHAEAFGLVLIEAMAMALPVIAAGCDGVLDIVTDRANGILVSPHSVDQLTKAAGQLVGDTDLRYLLGRQARDTVRKNFSITAMIERLEGLYCELIPRLT